VYKSYSACRKHSHVCGNYTLHVKIAPYVHESHSCVSKSHSACFKHTFVFQNYSRAYRHHTLRIVNTLKCVKAKLMRVKIMSKSQFCVRKSHPMCMNHTRACRNYTLSMKITLYVYKSHPACFKHTFVFQNHFRACRNQTLRIGNTRVCVNITLMHVDIIVGRREITIMRLKVSPYLHKSHLCVSKSHS
jgi:hypothetical protein